jgi:hypothetical protein
MEMEVAATDPVKVENRCETLLLHILKSQSSKLGATEDHYSHSFPSIVEKDNCT